MCFIMVSIKAIYINHIFPPTTCLNNNFPPVDVTPLVGFVIYLAFRHLSWTQLLSLVSGILSKVLTDFTPDFLRRHCAIDAIGEYYEFLGMPKKGSKISFLFVSLRAVIKNE